MERLLFLAAFAFYTLSTALAFGYLFSKRETLSLWMWRFLGVGTALHLASFVLRTWLFWEDPSHRFFLPFHGFQGVFSWLALSVAVIFWVVEGRHRLQILGAFVLPWAWAASAAALVWGEGAPADLAPVLQSYWLNVHPLVLMTCYAAFANAAGVGLALLVQDHQMKSRKPSELCFRLPSLEELDALHLRLIGFFFPALTLGLLLGSVWAYLSWGRFWGWDAKEVWALITWGVYMAYLDLRLRRGRRGPKTIYVSMAGFASVLVTFAVVNGYSNLHGYLVGRG